jgi:glycosyltransferase involved in cell wall biosynthesis
MCSYIDTIRKFSKAKIVLRAHNIEHIIWERHLENQSNFSKKWYLKLQTKRLKKFELENFQKVDAIVPITPADEMLIKEFVGDKVLRTVLTGVNMDEYSIEKSEFFEQKSIFCFGSMDWLPNQLAVQWFLDNCWPNVIREVPDCKFVIAGRNIPSSFKNLSDSRIIILENVPHPEEIYSKFNIMLVPLQSGSGLRIKIVEGLSYGKAIVSTRIGAEGISVESGKNIVLADEADEFSSRVVQLLRDSDRCNQLEINARSFASINLDNKKITSTLVEFYLNLIQD